MNKSTTIPILLDFLKIRSARQNANNTRVYDAIMGNNEKGFYENINKNELDRMLYNFNMSFEEFWISIRDDDMRCKLAASKLAKCSSRQGSKDEAEQIRTCNLTTQHHGVFIENLSATAFRPTKDGRIFSGSEIKEKKIQKDCCLKSFDGAIRGNMNGYIAAKVAYGNGGHQDNVFEEMDIISEWWSNFKKGKDEILVLLIDSDLTEKIIRLKEKYKANNNIMVFNHFEFQNYVITTYPTCESM